MEKLHIADPSAGRRARSRMLPRRLRRGAVGAGALLLALALAMSTGGSAPSDRADGSAPLPAGSAGSPGAAGSGGPAGSGGSPGTAPSGGSSLLPPGPLATDGARIVGPDGSTAVIRAVNWFGLETDTCAPHGLWARSMAQILDQIASFGFNAIRLPYANECLDPAAQARGIDAAANPSLQGLTPLQVMDAVIAGARERGLRVLLDRHRPGNTAQSQLWYTDEVPESRWIDDWVMLAQRYRDDDTVIGADLHNEPHGPACWACGDRSRDWAAAAKRAGDAVLAAAPDWLIVVEGVERARDGSTTWWGGGLADVRSAPIRLAQPGRLVYSPHDYPQSVFPQRWFSAPDYPRNLPAVWDANWGYLVRDDIAPVLVGEFGTRLRTESDRQWLAALVAYLAERSISFAYWSFNPNSGDTGGLVADDWITPQAEKLAALAPLLRPGAPAPSSPQSGPPQSGPQPSDPPSASPSGPAPSLPAPTPPAPSGPWPSATPAPGAPGLSGSWSVTSSWGEGYVAQLTITAGDPRTGWTVSWPDPGATGIAGSWGMTCTLADGVVTCASSDWTQVLSAGQTVTVGVQVQTPAGAPADPPLTFGP